MVKWSRRRNICWKNTIKSTGKCNRHPWKLLDHLETGLVKWSSTTLGINPNKFGSLIEPGKKTWSNGQVVKHLLQIPLFDIHAPPTGARWKNSAPAHARNAKTPKRPKPQGGLSYSNLYYLDSIKFQVSIFGPFVWTNVCGLYPIKRARSFSMRGI